jgi:alanine racemase
VFHTSFLEISSSALKSNLDFLQRQLGDTPFSAVVKGNAYGHGIAEYVPLLYHHGVRHFSVFNAHEALRVHENLPEDVTIMNMGMIGKEEIPWAIENNIELYVFDTPRLKEILKEARKQKKKANIHLELETGMNRTGLDTAQLKEAQQLLADEKEYRNIKGICTHLAGAESIANYKRIKDQYRRFKKLVPKLQHLVEEDTALHMASSAASLRYPKTRFDLVRIGILQYGFFPTEEILVHYLSKKKMVSNPLKRVISWKSTVMDITHVDAGKFVGYGTSYFTNTPAKIALIPVGYANGYNRSLSNQGKLLIKGRRVEVVGTVNMNMLAADVTEIPNVERGDEVVLIGRQGELEISVASFGSYSNQLNYESLTRLSNDIPRKIIE